MNKAELLNILPQMDGYTTSTLDANAGYVFCKAMRKAYQMRDELNALRLELIGRFKVPTLPDNPKALDTTSPAFAKLAEAWEKAISEPVDLGVKELDYFAVKPLFDENKVKVATQSLLMDIFVKEE